MASLRWLAGTTLVSLLAVPAHAETGLMITPEYQTGQQTPTGYYGLNLDLQPVGWLSVAGGFGWSNFQNSSQLQLALSPRVRWPALDWLALYLGAALSRGERSDYQNLPGPEPSVAGPSLSRRWSPGYRLGPEIGAELTPLPRGRLRLFGGLALPLDGPTCWTSDGGSTFNGSCDDPRVPAAGRSRRTVEPYFGLALGWTLIGPVRSARLVPLHRWYGWQTLLVDAGAAVLVAAGDNEQASGFSYAARRQGPFIFLLGGPLVHLTHHRPVPSALSLLLRGGSVVAAYAVGHQWDHNECVRFECQSQTLMVVGGAVAALVDAVWLAHTPAR